MFSSQYSMSQYAIGADSRRWWWPSAAAGAVAITVAVAIPATARNAVPVDAASGWAGTGRAGEIMTMGVTGSRPCFMGRASWDDDGYGPQPVCGPACPPPPDIRYVGVPWVTPVPTGCVSVDRWWEAIDDRRR